MLSAPTGVFLKLPPVHKKDEKPAGFFVHYRGKKRNVADGVDIRRNMNYDYLNSTSTDIVSDEWPECFYRDACQSHDYW